jgi:hypothetical protein
MGEGPSPTQSGTVITFTSSVDGYQVVRSAQNVMETKRRDLRDQPAPAGSVGPVQVTVSINLVA